jgi:hypothetical protein
MAWLSNLLLAMGLMRLTPLSSYTSFNVLLWMYAGFVDARIWPVVYTNTLAVSCTFITGGLLDATMYQRIRERHGWSMRMFVAGDVLLHHVPSLYVLVSACAPRWMHSEARSPPGPAHTRIAAFAELYSLLLNLVWSVLRCGGGFNASAVYAQGTDAYWRNVHISMVLFHLLAGLVCRIAAS